jgi:hypothetical protein
MLFTGHTTRVERDSFLQEICVHENNIGMDIKQKAERKWNAFTCHAEEDVDPVAGPGFTQSKEFLFYLLPASLYFN